MSVVLLSGDLMVASRVEGAAARAGVALETASTVEQAIAICDQGRVKLLLVDLSASCVKPRELIEQLHSHPGGRPSVIAFGPHVHEPLLSAAREASCDEVVSRGEFFARLDVIVRSAFKKNDGSAGN